MIYNWTPGEKGTVKQTNKKQTQKTPKWNQKTPAPI